MKKNIVSLTKRKVEIKKLQQKFLDDFDWLRLFYIWQETLSSFGINSSNLFVEVKIKEEKMKMCDSYLSWWPKGKIEESKSIVIEEFPEKISGCTYPAASVDRGFSKGDHYSLQFMWELRNEPKKLAAFLLCASMFPRVKSGRLCVPEDDWPPHPVAFSLYEMIWKELNLNEKGFVWGSACTKVLPVYNSEWHFDITSLPSLIQYLAIEHCKLLTKYQPVRVAFN